jgi:hypothetical protein
MRRVGRVSGVPNIVVVQAPRASAYRPTANTQQSRTLAFHLCSVDSSDEGGNLRLGTSVHATASGCAAIAHRLGGRRDEEAQQMNATGRALPHTGVHAVILGLSARKVCGNNGGAVFGGNDQRR